jgi:hypothetical protein
VLICAAASFYDFDIILLPTGLTSEQTSSLIAQSSGTILVAEAGVFDFDAAIPAKSSIKDVVLVAKGGSKDIDWEDDKPKGISVTAWHNLVSNNPSLEVPPLNKETKPRPISIFTDVGNGKYELVEFTSQVRLLFYMFVHEFSGAEYHLRDLSAECNAHTRQ